MTTACSLSLSFKIQFSTGNVVLCVAPKVENHWRLWMIDTVVELFGTRSMVVELPNPIQNRHSKQTLSF